MRIFVFCFYTLEKKFLIPIRKEYIYIYIYIYLFRRLFV